MILNFLETAKEVLINHPVDDALIGITVAMAATGSIMKYRERREERRVEKEILDRAPAPGRVVITKDNHLEYYASGGELKYRVPPDPS